MAVNVKNLIADTFIALVKNTPVDKITVTELVSKCGISRQAFYYHFQDIMEVIEWSFQQALDNMLERSLQTNSPEDAIQVFVVGAKEQYPIIRKLLHSQKRDQVGPLFMRAIQTCLQKNLQQKMSELALPHSDMEIALHYWTCGIVGVLLESCAQGAFDAKTLSRQLYQLMAGTMIDLPKVIE